MRCGALIAAAGVPAELEQFLPLAKVGGTSIIKRQIRVFKQLGVDPIVVVTGYHAALLERHLAHSSVLCIRNRRYATTRLIDSIRLGMDALMQTDAVLIVPGDVPYLHPDTLRALLDASTPIAGPQHGHRLGHPILVRRECFDALLGYDGPRGLRGFMLEHAAQVTRVPVDDSGVLLSVNTAEKLAAAQASHLSAIPAAAHVDLSLRYGGFLLNEELIRLLRTIGETGSLRAACMEMQIAYSRAWIMLGKAEEALGVPLLIRKLGGAAGGGSGLTPEALALADSFSRLAQELEREANRLLQREFSTQG